MYITAGTEWHLLSCCHGNTLGSSLILWKTKYPHLQPFKVGQRVLLWARMVPIMSKLSPLAGLLGVTILVKDKILELILVLIETGPSILLLSCQRHDGCHFLSFVMYISDAKFEEHCFNISRDTCFLD